MFQNNYIDSEEIPLESRDSGAAEIRDQELIQHSSHADGFQYISGKALLQPVFRSTCML